MTPEVGQANPSGTCPGHTAFSIALGEFMAATSRVGQVGQAKSYCTHVSLFSEWKGKRRGYNRETPVPLVPPNETRTGDTASGDSWSKRTPAEPVPPPPIPTDTLSVPLEQCIFDPLYTGTLTGKVPNGWSRDGWVMSLRDRSTRTDDPEVKRRLKDELRAVEGEAERA